MTHIVWKAGTNLDFVRKVEPIITRRAQETQAQLINHLRAKNVPESVRDIWKEEGARMLAIAEQHARLVAFCRAVIAHDVHVSALDYNRLYELLGGAE